MTNEEKGIDHRGRVGSENAKEERHLYDALRVMLGRAIESVMFCDDRSESDYARVLILEGLGPDWRPTFHNEVAAHAWQTIARWTAAPKGTGMSQDDVLALRSAMMSLHSYLLVLGERGH